MNHVLAEDGSKMSKSKGNTIHPKELFDTVGADAMRWYLCSTPAWNPMRFGKNLVGDAQRRVLNTLWNVYSFFVTNANVDNYNPTERMKVNDRSSIDRWIISRLQIVIRDVKEGMETMTFHTCVKILDYFILEELSNWYVRRSRRRFYGKDLTADKRAGYDTLYEVLTTLSRLMAPLTPFIVEELYQNLEHRLNPDNLMSVHMHLFPECNNDLIDYSLESEMAVVLAVTNAARTARAEAGIKARQPLSELVVNLKDSNSQITKGFIEVIEKEINVKSINFVTDDADFVDYKVQPLLKKLAPKVRGAIKTIKPYLESLSREDAKQIVQSVNKSGKVSMRIDEQEWEFTSDELLVHALPTDGYIMGESRGVDVFLKTEITDDLRLEGLARGVIRHIQENRKKIQLDYLDRINVNISTNDEMMKNAILLYKDYIKTETQADTLSLRKRKNAELQKIDGREVALLVEPV